MNNKILIIVICSILLIAVTFGLTYKQAYNFIEKQLSFVADSVNLVTGLGSTYHDRVIYFRDINSKSFGSVNINNVTYDIGEYIKNNYLPSYLYTLEPNLIVNVTLSPKLYNASFKVYTGILALNKTYYTLENALRFNINITGSINGQLINTTINMLYGDAVDGKTGTKTKLYFCFDVITDTYKFGKNYSDLDYFLSDISDLKWNIIKGGKIGNEDTIYARTLIDYVTETNNDLTMFFE